jgi:hypothetical protein
MKVVFVLLVLAGKSPNKINEVSTAVFDTQLTCLEIKERMQKNLESDYPSLKIECLRSEYHQK